jgi:hypothetical protein
MSSDGASEAAKAAEVERRMLVIPLIRRVPGADIADDAERNEMRADIKSAPSSAVRFVARQERARCRRVIDHLLRVVVGREESELDLVAAIDAPWRERR